MPKDVLDRASLTGTRVFWLLDLSIGGSDFHLSTDSFEVEKADGTALQYLDGIDDVQWEDTLDLFADSPGEVSVPFSVVIPGFNVAQLVSKGFDLAAATGQLSRWIDGTTYEERQVVLKGPLSEPTYGAENEPFAFSLATSPYEDRSILPSPTAVVDEVTWPNAADKANGKTYPTVYGRPGDHNEAIPGSPAHVVHTGTKTLLIAGHEVSATTVYVCNADVDVTDWDSASVVHTTDGRGRQVATVVVPAGITWSSDDTYFVAWAHTSGGGMWDRRRQGPLEKAGDVLDYFLDQTTLTVDQGRTAAEALLLNRYILAGYIDEPVNVWAWLRANILPILPVSIRVGPDGLYPVVWRYDGVVDRDVVEHIDVARLDAERTSPVEYTATTGGKLANEIQLSYRLNADSGDYTASVTLTGDDSVARSSSVLTNQMSRVSRARYGEAAKSIETDHVYDVTTAAKIVQWMSYAWGLPARNVSYLFDQRARHLQLGAIVSLTDDELYISELICMVVEIRDADVDQIEVSFRSIEEPARSR